MKTMTYPVAGEETTVFIPERDEDCAAFREWVMCNTNRAIALDTETTGLDIYSPGYRLRTVQFGNSTEAWVLHWEKGEPFRKAVQYALKSLPWLLIHNASFDWLVIDKHAAFPMESMWERTVDTKIMSHLVDPRSRQEGGIGTSLEDLTREHVDPDVADLVKASMKVLASELKVIQAKIWETVDIDNPTYNLYAGMDTILTSRVYDILYHKLKSLGVPQGLKQYEHEIAYICAYMQRTGMVLDRSYVDSLSEALIDERLMNETRAAMLGVENVNATAQVAEALVSMGEVITDLTPTGKLKVDKSVLLAMADMDLNWNKLNLRDPNPLAEAVLRSKRAGKWHSSYVQTFLDTVDENGRIHPMINALQARTGRMSINRPALQTLPSSDFMIRRAFLADPGEVMISTDFKAVEMRVLAAIADVKRMKEAISEGADLHDYTASMLFGPDFTKEQRKHAKIQGLGTIFGGGIATLQRQTGAPMHEVKSTHAKYHSVYPEIKRMSTLWQQQAKQNGYVFISATGRRLPLDKDRTFAVVNYACQSLARDCLGQALVTMKQQGLLPYLRLPIHDEILASAPKADAEDIAREIKKAMTFDLFGVPIDADAEIGGKSWGSLYGADV